MVAFDPESRVKEKVLYAPGDLAAFSTELERAASALPRRINADPQNVDRGLAKLVLTLIELLRRVMEHQAIQRIEGGSLSEEEIERLGQTFMKLAEKMEELKQTFGLGDEDLNIDLGPLGNLL